MLSSFLITLLCLVQHQLPTVFRSHAKQSFRGIKMNVLLIPSKKTQCLILQNQFPKELSHYNPRVCDPHFLMKVNSKMWIGTCDSGVTGNFWSTSCHFWNICTSSKLVYKSPKKNIIKFPKTELDMEQWTCSNLGNEYVMAVYCHPAYLTYMQSTSCETPGLMRK